MYKQLLLLLICATLLERSYGWGATGHMIVAQISMNYISGNSSNTWLTGALQNAIDSLPTYFSASGDYVTSAAWMDDIRGRGMSQFDMWHYIDLPICAFPDPSNCTSNPYYNTLMNSLVMSDTALWAINQSLATIRTRAASGFERGFALRNLLHIIGDIHQPLHCAARFSPDTPNGDRGGNDFKIRYNNASTNLHSFWDGGAGMYLGSYNIPRPLNTTNMQYIQAQASMIMNQTVLVPGISDSLNTTYWAIEGFEKANDYVYSNVTFNQDVDQAYIDRSQAICIQQLGIAGYRLALVLQSLVACTNTSSNCPSLPTTYVEKQVDVENPTVMHALIGVSVLSGVLAVVVIILSIMLHSARRRAAGTYEGEHIPLTK